MKGDSTYLIQFFLCIVPNNPYNPLSRHLKLMDLTYHILKAEKFDIHHKSVQVLDQYNNNI